MSQRRPRAEAASMAAPKTPAEFPTVRTTRVPSRSLKARRGISSRRGRAVPFP